MRRSVALVFSRSQLHSTQLRVTGGELFPSVLVAIAEDEDEEDQQYEEGPGEADDQHQEEGGRKLDQVAEP